MAEDEGRIIPADEARVRAKIRKVKTLDNPRTSLILGRDGTTYSGNGRYYKAGVLTGNRRGEVQGAATGQLTYLPSERKLKVDFVNPTVHLGKELPEFSSFSKAHEQYAGKIMKRAHVKDVIEKLAKAFPKADVVEGSRITGMHVGEGLMGLQRFNLAAVRDRLAKSGKLGKAAALAMGISKSLLKK